MEDDDDILLEQSVVHPLIKSFAERIAVEAQELADKHSEWTLESVLAGINITIPSIIPRIRHTRISGYQLAMREEKADAPPEALVGGKNMRGQWAQWVAPRYKAKKAEYDARAEEIRKNKSTPGLQNIKEYHKTLLKAIRKSAVNLAEQRVNVLLMAISPEPGVDPFCFHSEGYARRFMNLMEDAKISFTEFQQICMGDQLLKKAIALEPQRKAPRDARREEVRKKLLVALKEADKSGKKAKIEMIPRQEGKLIDLLASRSIIIKSPSDAEGWPQDLRAIELLLQSNRDSDVTKVLAALEAKTLVFRSTI